MLRAVPALLCSLALGLAACGDDDTATTTPRASPDATAVKRLADKYLRAILTKDWRAACQTRADRRALARIAGSCVRSFELIEESGEIDGAESLLGGARVRADRIEIRGRRARVPVLDASDGSEVLVLLARRTSGRWLLVDVPDGKRRAFMRGESVGGG